MAFSCLAVGGGTFQDNSAVPPEAKLPCSLKLKGHSLFPFPFFSSTSPPQLQLQHRRRNTTAIADNPHKDQFQSVGLAGGRI
jgi:hypothetical protein